MLQGFTKQGTFFQSPCWARPCARKAIPSHLHLPASLPCSSPRPEPSRHTPSWLPASFHAGDSSAEHELKILLSCPRMARQGTPRLQRMGSVLGGCRGPAPTLGSPEDPLGYAYEQAMEPGGH